MGERTALMWAVEHNNKAIVKKLLAKNPDLNAKDGEGQTALMWAFSWRRHNKEIILMLLAHNPDLDLRDDYGNTALYIAQKNHVRMVLLRFLHNIRTI